jgi:acetyl-CoA carboxylase carboxyl transferase subunit alpha
MSIEILEFEEPIGELLKEIEALELKPPTPERKQTLETLRQRVGTLRQEIYSTLTPWQQVLVARHPSRPHTLDYVERIFSDFTEIHGDRRFGDDPAIVCGLARFGEQPVLVVGNQKGRGTREKIRRNFGYAKPEGYRKALRAMQLAEKFHRPIIVFVDTPAAYPGIGSEERGVAEAIATNLREMAMLRVPVIVIVSGEGGSGGALGLAIGDRILIQEHAVYSVIPPEGCAAILWRDAEQKMAAAAALKITARDLLALKVVDEIVPEPLGGAHTDIEAASQIVEQALRINLTQVSGLSPTDRLELRYQKFRLMGNIGLDVNPVPPKVHHLTESLGETESSTDPVDAKSR